MDNSVSVVLPIHNQEDLVQRVVQGIIDNTSNNVKEIIIILDGCTDQTEKNLDRMLPRLCDKMEISIVYAPNVFEVIANNIGFKMSKCKYSLTIQDDMILNELNFDQRLLEPFTVVENLLGVTARNAQNETIINGRIEYFNVAGRDVNTPRQIFAIRDVIVRGPIMFDNAKLKELNYLDVDFAPLDGDDKNLSFRAYEQFGYVVGSYVCDYISELAWGGTRKSVNSYSIWEQSALKNIQLLMERHKDSLMGTKHDKDIYLP